MILAEARALMLPGWAGWNHPYMPRFRRSDPTRPGIARRRCGKGFTYVAADGAKVTDTTTLERIRGLVIPPAWTDVWICPHDNGHLQAVGTDQAGRRQYLYHPLWRQRREQEKWERILEFADRLPALRAQVQRDLGGGRKLTRERVLACSVRLLDRGLFRIGSEQYAEENQTFGLATVRCEHVHIDGEMVTFDYPAKHGKQRVQRIIDRDAVRVVRRLMANVPADRELLGWCDADGTWVDLRAADVNEYVKAAIGEEFSAKDFRSWHGTVRCAVALAITAQADRLRMEEAKRRTQAVTPRSLDRLANAGPSKRKVARAVQEVSWYLGNTPAVCRASYIDPRVIDRYLGGSTIEPALHAIERVEDIDMPDAQLAVETAVLELIGGRSERTIRKVVERTLEQAGAA